MPDHSSSPPAPPHSGARVLVAMSGGVDSSVAAALLVRQGFEVVGATMKTFCYTRTEGPSRTCCGMDGIRDARAVARTLGIEHHVFDVEEEFRRDVIDDFVAEYARGRTPNPCVRCNSNTKFRDLLRRGRALGCDYIASGHYARVSRVNGEAILLRGHDDRKDQSYFLWGISREILDRLLLPVGDLTKPEVRAQARELELAVAEKAESQEICFVPDGRYRDLLERRLGPEHPSLSPGRIEDTAGGFVGEHDGFAGFTVGQRRGLGGGRGERLYVLGIRADDRTVIVGPREGLAAHGAAVEDPNWLVARAPDPGSSVSVRIRHGAPRVPATVVEHDDRSLTVAFASSQSAVTPGQSAVLYDGDRVLGGGRISAAVTEDQRLRPAASANAAIASRASGSSSSGVRTRTSTS